MNETLSAIYSHFSVVGSESIDGATVVALVGILSTGILGWFGYRRSKKADSVAEKAGAVEQIINGLNILVENLQEDNKDLRSTVGELRDALEKALQERDSARSELKALHRQYGQTS